MPLDFKEFGKEKTTKQQTKNEPEKKPKREELWITKFFRPFLPQGDYLTREGTMKEPKTKGEFRNLALGSSMNVSPFSTGREVRTGLDVMNRTFSGAMQAIGEPEKEKQATSVRQAVSAAFRTGFEKPEDTSGLFGKEFVESYNMPWQVAGTLGTMAELGLYSLPAKMASGIKGLSKIAKSKVGRAQKEMQSYQRWLSKYAKPELQPSTYTPKRGIAPRNLSTLDNFHAQKRGVMSFREQSARAAREVKNITQKDFDNLNPGDITDVVRRRALGLKVVEQAQQAAKTNNSKLANTVVNNLQKIRAITSETARSLGAHRDQIFKQEMGLWEQIAQQGALISPKNKVAMNEFMKKLGKPGVVDKLLEFRLGSLLTSPRTFLRNAVGNTFARTFRIPQRAAAGVWDGSKSAFFKMIGKPYKRTRFTSEAIADTVGMFRGLPKALNRSLKTLRTGQLSEFSKVELGKRGVRTGAIQGLKGKLVRTPFRILGAADEFHTELSKSASLYSQATRQALSENPKHLATRVAQLVKNPTLKMANQAADEALEETFRLPLGTAGKAFQKAINKTPALKWFVPFFRTPTNIFKYFFQRSPLGIASPKNWHDILKGGGAQADAIGRLIIGNGLSAYTFKKALDGYLTPPPKDRRESREMYRRGTPPNSIKVGEKWYSYRGYQPISSYLAMMSSMADAWKKRGEIPTDELVWTAAMASARELKNTPFLMGAEQFINILDGSQEMAVSTIQRMLKGSVLPTGVWYVRQAIDPVYREANTFSEELKAGMPWLSKDLYPKTNIWGEPIEQKGSFMERMMVGGSHKPVDSKVEEELKRLDINFDPIDKTYRGIPLSSRNVFKLKSREGRDMKRNLEALVNSSTYERLPDREKERKIRGVANKVRSYWRDDFVQWKIQQLTNEYRTTDSKSRRKEIKRILKELHKRGTITIPQLLEESANK